MEPVETAELIEKLHAEIRFLNNNRAVETGIRVEHFRTVENLVRQLEQGITSSDDS